MSRAARLARWRAGLPDRLARIVRAWRLAVESRLHAGESEVWAVRDADGMPHALKLAPPGQGLEAEIAALRAFAPDTVAALRRAEARQGALLLARGGAPLSTLADDDAATRAAAALMARLPCAPPAGALFAEAAGWGRALRPGLIPEAMRDRAAGVLRDLVASAGPARLLHGDLHGGNILAFGGGWRAVDPKGLLGDPVAEAACWLRNPADPDRLVRAARRAEIIAEVTGWERARVAAWGYAGAVIAACWAVEDGRDPAPFLAAAEALAPPLPR